MDLENRIKNLCTEILTLVNEERNAKGLGSLGPIGDCMTTHQTIHAHLSYALELWENFLTDEIPLNPNV